MELHQHTLILIGVLLLALVTVESGGVFLVRVVRGNAPANLLQRNFFRAGHAHAAVLLILSIVILLTIDHLTLSPVLDQVARLAVPVAAILMPAGFFLSVTGTDPEKPNRLIVLLWIGATVLTIGLITVGITLIVAGATAS